MVGSKKRFLTTRITSANRIPRDRTNHLLLSYAVFYRRLRLKKKPQLDNKEMKEIFLYSQSETDENVFFFFLAVGAAANDSNPTKTPKNAQKDELS